LAEEHVIPSDGNGVVENGVAIAAPRRVKKPKMPRLRWVARMQNGRELVVYARDLAQAKKLLVPFEYVVPVTRDSAGHVSPAYGQILSAEQRDADTDVVVIDGRNVFGA
jgi:hypothetical protein